MTGFYTYLHCKPDGTPFYVGKGSGRRCREFKSGRNLHHKRIVAKYGEESIQVYVFPCESSKQALFDEIQQIAQLRRDGYQLVNLTDGGEGALGRTHSPESLAKIVARHTGAKRSEETKRKISESRKGNPKCLGKKSSEETKEKMRAAHKNRKPISEETRVKQSAAQKGHHRNLGSKRSEESKAKMSLAQIGNKKSLGFKHSDEFKALISSSKKGKPLSEEHKLRISNSKKGIPSSKKGIPLSEDQKKKMSASRKGKTWTEARVLAQKRRIPCLSR